MRWSFCRLLAIVIVSAGPAMAGTVLDRRLQISILDQPLAAMLETLFEVAHTQITIISVPERQVERWQFTGTVREVLERVSRDFGLFVVFDGVRFRVYDSKDSVVERVELAGASPSAVRAAVAKFYPTLPGEVFQTDASTNTMYVRAPPAIVDTVKNIASSLKTPAAIEIIRYGARS